MLENSGQIIISKPQIGMKYSVNNGTVVQIESSENDVIINLNFGDIVSFLGEGSSITSYYGTRITSNDKKFRVYGNILSLIDEIHYSTRTSITNGSEFRELFYDAKYLTDASYLILNAITLSQHCYSHMFYGCSSLTDAPKLPTTSLATYCYSYMFAGCSSLSRSPKLNSTNLQTYCYSYMFQNCTNLVLVSELPAEILYNGCYKGMFYGCNKLSNAPRLIATTLYDSCYYEMFYGCTSLTIAPALPATTMANRCYAEMFSDCISLINAPALPATTLAEDCYVWMFCGCTSLTSIVLPATSIKDAHNCYDLMLVGCTSLSYIKAMFIDWNNEFYLFGTNFAENGIFVKNTLATWDESSVDFIPDGWTVIDEIS